MNSRYLLNIETAQGEITLEFSNVQESMRQIGAANLATLRDWTKSLETKTSERIRVMEEYFPRISEEVFAEHDAFLAREQQRRELEEDGA